MKKFVNREEELDFLNREFEKQSSSLIIIYGRRRTGKTTLITKFGEDKDMFYFFATEEFEAENKNNFKNFVAEYTDNKLLRKANIDNWELIFNELVKYNPNNKKLIVIDEFQYLGKANPAFPSILQKIWDTQIKNNNIMIILCGSLVPLMEEQTLSYSSPLYGRRTGQIKLKPISFQDYHEFFTEKDRKELIEYYSVTGGVPKYIELFQDEKDIFTAIYKNILARQSFLYEEPIFLLKNEVWEIGNYFSIIKAIAAGNYRLSKIAAALQIKQTNLSKYLNTLIDLDILERQVPITEENPQRSKRGIYKIKDNYIEFWFKFIYPYKHFLEMGNTEMVMNKIKKNIVDNHISFIYEDICIEEMWRLNLEGNWNFHFDRVGRWWDNDTEIDIVAYDRDGLDIIFGECKFTNKPMDINIYYELLEKSRKVKWKNNRREYFVFFSISGFTKAMEDLAKDNKNIFLYN